MSDHCRSCPISEGRTCAGQSLEWLCEKAEIEANQPDHRQHFWTHAIERETTRLDGLPGPRPFPAALPTDGRIRLGILSDCCYLGGAERKIADILDTLDPGLIRVEGVAIRSEPTSSGTPTFLANWEEHAPVRLGDQAIRALGKRVDIILTWGIPSVIIDRLLPADLPVVEVSHCAFDTDAAHSLSSLDRAIKVAVGREALKGLAPQFRQAAKIIWNAVSPDRVQPIESREEIRSRWGIPQGAKVVGWLARISPEKHPERWIEAVENLPSNWFGVMVGSGLGSDDARAYAAQIGAGRVVFAGPTEDIGSALAGFDSLLMTSQSEGFCFAIAEALLAGVPVISTKVGILAERPDLARILPDNPTVEDIDRAVADDQLDSLGTSLRVSLGKRFAATELSPARFGREWSDLLVAAARREPAARAAPATTRPARKREDNPHLVRIDLARGCDYRGDVSSDSISCACRVVCLKGKGSAIRDSPMKSVSIRDCLDCVSSSAG